MGFLQLVTAKGRTNQPLVDLSSFREQITYPLHFFFESRLKANFQSGKERKRRQISKTVQRRISNGRSMDFLENEGGHTSFSRLVQWKGIVAYAAASGGALRPVFLRRALPVRVRGNLGCYSNKKMSIFNMGND